MATTTECADQIPLDENNNQLITASPIASSSSSVTCSVTNSIHPIDDKYRKIDSSSDEANDDDYSSDDSDDLQPPKKKLRRETNQRESGTTVSNILATKVYLEQKIQGGGAERIINISVDRLERLLSSRKERCSQPFFCKELEWRVEVGSSGREGRKYIGIFLQCVNFRETDILSAEASAKIRMLNPRNRQNDELEEFDFIISCNDLAYGIEKFCLFDELKPFKQNGCIKLKICLKVLKVIKHS